MLPTFSHHIDMLFTSKNQLKTPPQYHPIINNCRVISSVAGTLTVHSSATSMNLRIGKRTRFGINTTNPHRNKSILFLTSAPARRRPSSIFRLLPWTPVFASFTLPDFESGAFNHSATLPFAPILLHLMRFLDSPHLTFLYCYSILSA